MNKILKTLSVMTVTGLFGVATTCFAAKLVVINADEPGIGFNDATAARPVGQNTGKTVGEQRLIATNFVASLWGRTLGGNDTIEVLASFAPQECDASGGVLASAGPFTVNRDFDNARFRNTWYAAALANRLAKKDLDVVEGNAAPEMVVFSNGDVGKAGCIDGSSWYYGLDDKAPENTIDYVKTILHEFGHGLGFLSLADETTGALFDGRPSIWEHYMLDGRTSKLWVNMTDAERKASALNNQFLAWTGLQSYIGAQSTLADTNVLDIYLFDSAGTTIFAGGNANFGVAAGRRSAAGLIGLLDDTRAPGAACAALTAAQTAQVRGRIAVIDRGGCAFTDKAKNAQAAGASAIIFVNNNPVFFGRPSFGLDDPSVRVTVPTTLISQQDGVRLRQGGQRFATASLFDGRRPAGTDMSRRPLLFAPTVNQPGSSVSHWDVSATPNLLMEPFAVGDEATTLRAPRDLTLPLLKDIGW